MGCKTLYCWFCYTADRNDRDCDVIVADVTIGCLFPRERSQDALGANGSTSLDRSHNALGASGSNFREQSQGAWGANGSTLRGKSQNALGANGSALHG
jgi:hypothetical protein